MSIQYMDNFSNYGSGSTGADNLLDGTPWGELGVQSGQLPTDPDTGSGRVLNIGYSTLVGASRLSLPTPDDKVGIAARFYFNSMPFTSNTACSIMQWRTAMNVTNYILRVEPNGALSLYYGGAQIATTTVPYITTHAWFHIEAYVDVVTGNYEVRREGVPIAALTGVHGAPPGGTTAILAFSNNYSGSGVATVYMKDLVVWDSLGTQNTSFVGPVSVYTLGVTSDVSSGWTRSTGATDYGLLDETTPDDTDYISAGTPVPAASIMGLSDLPADVVSVKGLQTVIRAKKTDGGDATVQVSLVSGVSTDTGANNAMTTAMKYWLDISELDPATAALWTPTGVNAAQLKIDRTT